MLTITLPGYELFNDETQEFITENERVIKLEHSLLSISEWESKWNKPFLSNIPKTPQEISDYVRCMTLTEDVPEIYLKFIFSSSNAFNAPICAAPFTPPPDKANPKLILITHFII